MGRQAVIIIHGMGEQRPMDTLRSFVDSLKNHLGKNDITERNTNIWSKPDGIAEIYETRRLTLSGTHNRPITDFYEFYWAHNMRDTKFINFSTWIFKLLFSRRTIIPLRLLPIWKAIWIFLILSGLVASVVLLLVGFDKRSVYWKAIAFVPPFFTLITLFVQSKILSSVGDAGRYFTPSPGNIGERSKIRQQGITFLKKIQNRTDGEKYDRVILVAHSLGGVIAYDLLKLLWSEYHDTYDKVEDVDQDALMEIEKYSKGNMEIEDINLFQDVQFQCWQQQKIIGNKWLISDFITIGCPLCYADYLILNSLSFDELKIQREFPTSPPLPDPVRKEIQYPSNVYQTEKGKRTIRLLHHAALFAVTRWTNIYFSSDFIGGPMQRLFGKGVKDVELPRNSLRTYPGGHTNYWDINNEESLKKIADALHLRGDSYHEPPIDSEK